MEDHAMSLVGNGYARFTRRGFLSALGVAGLALLALVLLDPGAASAQQQAAPPPPKQIKLTEKQVQGLIAAFADMAKLYEKVDPDKPDPKIQAQAEALAKKNGFASLDEYDDVSFNVSIIMSGIDPQTKKFSEPPEQLKKEIAALKADKSVSDADKKEGLAQLEAALKTAKPVQFKDNVTLVLKYFDKLSPLMQQQG
jgi:hypothetical protein